MKVSEVSQSCPTLWDLRDYSLPGSSIHPWDLLGKNTGVGCHFLLQGNLPNPGIEPASSALQADSLQSEPSEKPLFYRYTVLTFYDLEIGHLSDL